jgi:hypothetical protein
MPFIEPHKQQKLAARYFLPEKLLATPRLLVQQQLAFVQIHSLSEGRPLELYFEQRYIFLTTQIAFDNCSAAVPELSTSPTKYRSFRDLREKFTRLNHNLFSGIKC